MKDFQKIKQNISDLLNNQKEIEKVMKKINVCCLNGTFIDEESLGNIIQQLLKVSELQNNISAQYGEIFPDKKICSDFNSVLDEITELEKAELEKEEKKSLFSFVTLFGLIRSKNGIIDSELNAIYEKAAAVDYSNMTVDECADFVKPYKEFYNIIKENMYSKDVKTILRLNNFFTPEICFPLAMGMLFISGSDGTPAPDEEHEEAPEEYQAESCKEEQPVEAVEEVTETAEQPVEAVEEVTETAEQPVEAVEEVAETAEQPVEDIEKKEKIEKVISEFAEFNIKMEKRAAYGNVSIEKGKEEKIKSSKAFKKDMEDNLKGNLYVAISFNYLRYPDANTLYYFDILNRDLSSDMIQTYFNSLLKNGYVRKISVEGYEPFYIASPQLAKIVKIKPYSDFMKKATIFKFNPSNYNQYLDSWEDNINLALTCTAGNMALSPVLSLRKHIKSKSISSNSSFSQNHNFNCIKYDGFTAIIASMFLENGENALFAKEIIDEMDDNFKCAPDILFTCSDDVEQCINIMNYLESKILTGKPKRVFFYCISDNTYYRYKDGNISRCENIFEDVKNEDPEPPEPTEETAEEVQEAEITEENAEEIQEAEITEETAEEVQEAEITEEIVEKVQEAEITEETAEEVQEVEEREVEKSDSNFQSADESVEESTAINKNDDDEADTIENNKPAENFQSEEENKSNDSPDIKEAEKADDEIIFYEDDVVYEYDEVMPLIYDMINSEKNYCVSAYLEAIKNKSEEFGQLRREFAYAMNDPAVPCKYTSSAVQSVFENSSSEPLSEYLKVCASLRAFFYNDKQRDYSYNSLYNSICGISFIAEHSDSPLVNLLDTLVRFRSNFNVGIDIVADYRIKENLKTENNLTRIKQNAVEFFNQHVNNRISNMSSERLKDTKRLIVSKESDLIQILQLVKNGENNPDNIELAKAVLYDNKFVSHDVEIHATHIEKDAIDNYVKEQWIKAGRMQNKQEVSKKIANEENRNLCNIVSNVLRIICEWIYYNEIKSDMSKYKEYEHLKSEAKGYIVESIDLCNDIINSGRCDIIVSAGYKCIRTVLNEFLSRLNGDYEENVSKYYYIDFLKYGEIMLDDNFMPIVSSYKFEPYGFKSTDRILIHAKKPVRDNFTERLDEIFCLNGDKLYFDDYGCAKLINKYYSECCPEKWDDNNHNFDSGDEKNAYNQFLRLRDEFIGTLELAQCYGKINTSLKEYLLTSMNIHFKLIDKSHNFGFFRRLVNCFKQHIEISADNKEQATLENIKYVLDDAENIPEAVPLIEKAREMLEIRNFTVAEDIVNRIQHGDYNLCIPQPNTTLDNFIQECEDYHNKVKDTQTSLQVLIPRLIRGNAANKNFARELLESFPKWNSLTEKNIENFLNNLGFNIKQVSTDSLKQYCFNVTVEKPLVRKRELYKHPVSPFGSFAEQNGFRVACIFKKYNADELLDKFIKIGSGKNTIVIFNASLSIDQRRILARKIKSKITNSVFILIDRTVVCYLANHCSQSTINSELMKVTMPFSSFQPYYKNSSNPIPVEMFMGRKAQLERIMSPKDINFLYGGRQLGKSALLKMAADEVNGDNNKRAVLSVVKEKNYKEAALKISYDLIQAKILPEGSETDDWEQLERNIINRLNSETEEYISFLLLLIDEADVFIKSCAEVKYSPLDHLENMQTFEGGRFKFVMAGLNNIVRFNRDILGKNNNFPHFSSETLLPLSYSEATELIRTPLSYLGLEFEEESYLESLILANTNYFPGLIHFYCAKLIEALQKDDYANYHESYTPPYKITESHIKKVLADPDFTDQIKKKLDITLRLDDDDYYYIIAIIMAYCYYENPNTYGYSANNIREIAKDFAIEKISCLDSQAVSAYMEEMCELNVLRKNKHNEYLFARYNFFQLLGSQEEIEDTIISYSEG